MFVSGKNEKLQYTGRINYNSVNGPAMMYPATSVRINVKNTEKVTVKLKNTRWCYNNYMGVLVDGEESCICLFDEEQGSHGDEFVLADDLEKDESHDILLFKRQDSAHMVEICGFELDEGGEILECPERPKLKLEFYGDSVTAGEVSEAVDYCKKPDPAHKGEFSNSYWSYAWITARMLNAEIHDNAQGGLALLDDTGWFAGPDSFKGIFSVYDKTTYHPDYGPSSRFDFKSYMPDIVIVALGQNDANPCNYMETDPLGEAADYWKKSYEFFISLLRKRRPDAHIILTTTILNHSVEWDNAIDEVCAKLQKNDPGIHHFLYSENGVGTPGHIRKPEAEKMASELSKFILGLLY